MGILNRPESSGKKKPLCLTHQAAFLEMCSIPSSIFLRGYLLLIFNKQLEKGILSASMLCMILSLKLKWISPASKCSLIWQIGPLSGEGSYGLPKQCLSSNRLFEGRRSVMPRASLKGKIHPHLTKPWRGGVTENLAHICPRKVGSGDWNIYEAFFASKKTASHWN